MERAWNIAKIGQIFGSCAGRIAIFHPSNLCSEQRCRASTTYCIVWRGQYPRIFYSDFSSQLGYQVGYLIPLGDVDIDQLHAQLGWYKMEILGQASLQP